MDNKNYRTGPYRVNIIKSLKSFKENADIKTKVFIVLALVSIFIFLYAFDYIGEDIKFNIGKYNYIETEELIMSYSYLFSFILIVAGFTIVPKNWFAWILLFLLSIPHLFYLYICVAFSELDILLALRVYFSTVFYFL